MRKQKRENRDRESDPTGAIIDSQSVETTEAGGPRGYDAGKAVWGRKRHVVVDTAQDVLDVVVHAANVQDRDGMHTGPGRPPTCDTQKYEQRNVVERLAGRLKERRRIAIRYEKKASHYKAMLQWAFIGECLKR